jgi:hypothetical protein
MPRLWYEIELFGLSGQQPGMHLLHYPVCLRVVDTRASLADEVGLNRVSRTGILGHIQIALDFRWGQRQQCRETNRNCWQIDAIVRS